MPYIQLTRLTSPAPILLIYLPHLFGILYAATVNRSDVFQTLYMSGVVAGGSVFFSNAAHIWNDLIDADLDGQVDRTRRRPIPRGAVSKPSALVFTVSQAGLALLFFIPFPLKNNVLYAVPSILGSAYYPFAKRHANYPQFVLGFCLSWGICVGAVAMVMRPFTISVFEGRLVIEQISAPLLLMIAACTFWTVIYDTVYAHLDLKHDLDLGIGSTAVAFRDSTKAFLWLCLGIMASLLVASGMIGRLGYAYFCLSSFGAIWSLSMMISQVDLRHPASCVWCFSNGFKYAGTAIASGLVVEYAMAIVSF